MRRRPRLRRRHARHKVQTLRKRPPGKPAPFSSVDKLLETASRMFHFRTIAARARTALEDVSAPEERPDEKEVLKAQKEEEVWSSYWHRSFELSKDGVSLCRRCHEHGLDEPEREIIVALILDRLSLLDEGMSTCGDVLGFMNVQGEEVVSVLRTMSEKGRLFRSKLIAYDDVYEDLTERKLIVDPVLVDEVLFENDGVPEGWPVKTEDEMHKHQGNLTLALKKKAREFDYSMGGHGGNSDFYKICRKADRLLGGLLETLGLHSRWGLSRLFRSSGLHAGLHVCKQEKIMLLALLGKELGHLPADDDLFLGKGLAQAASDSLDEVEERIRSLGSSGLLVEKGLVQPCGGPDQLLIDDPRAIEDTEFELTDKSLEILGIDRKLAKKRGDGPAVREAGLTMRQLVLSDKVRRALDMAAAQARHAKDLTGGEIKNAVLNAARLALTRDAEGPVKMDDFLAAIGMETKHRWSVDSGGKIGFSPWDGSGCRQGGSEKGRGRKRGKPSRSKVGKT